MIVPVNVQLKGESKPTKHLALVFDDVTGVEDFISYRNALTNVSKCIISSEEDYNLNDQCFWLIQLSEFISSSLDEELRKRLETK